MEKKFFKQRCKSKIGTRALIDFLIVIDRVPLQDFPEKKPILIMMYQKFNYLLFNIRDISSVKVIIFAMLIINIKRLMIYIVITIDLCYS